MVKTNQILISNKSFVLYDTLDKIDSYLEELELGKKDELHVRLLIEETLGMLGALTGEYHALLWAEKEDKECSVKLIAKTEMDVDKKRELLAVSKTGENALAKGFMGKIGDIIENGILNYENLMKLQQVYGGGYVDYAAIGGTPTETVFTWSLDQYKDALSNEMEENEAATHAWDELEKSIVASLAKDVIVGVKKDQVELTMVTELSGK
ncbi:MAG: hypothetical protein IJR29_01620 [Butyrivibrio sp.]|nr:hypothetical protein [Butyrivibrio sp.]